MSDTSTSSPSTSSCSTFRPSSPPPSPSLLLRTLACRMLLLRSAAVNMAASALTRRQTSAERSVINRGRFGQSSDRLITRTSASSPTLSPSSPPTTTPSKAWQQQGYPQPVPTHPRISLPNLCEEGNLDDDDTCSTCSSCPPSLHLAPMSPAVGEVNSNSEMASSSSASNGAMQGAKRRKPLKTNKVTKEQQQEANLHEEDELPRSPPPEPEAPNSPGEDSEPLQVNLSDDNGDPASLEPIIPPGPIPTPVISSTTVVTSDANSIYKCPLCDEDLPSQKDFTTHIRGHNEVKPHPDPNDPTGQAKVYYCCLCGKMLSSFSSLDRHMLVHSGERPFSCELCGQTFTTNGNMHRHKRTHSAKELQEYGEAMGVSLLPNGRRGGRKRKNATVATSAAKESRQPAEDKVGEEATAPDEQQEEPKDVTSGKYTCAHCGEAFETEEGLESHMENVHDSEEFKCDECPVSFRGYKLLKMHKIFHNAAAAAAAVGTILTGGAAPPPLTSAALTVPPSMITPTAQLAFQRGGTERSLPPPPPLRAAPIFTSPPLSSPPTSSSSISSPSSSVGKPLSAFSGPRQEAARAAADEQEVIDITDNSPPDPEAEPEQPDPESKETSALNNDDDTKEQNLFDSKKESEKQENTDDSLHNVDILGSHGDDDPMIKDMKLKGEFPCRLCPAVYPNLRALKGHNKEHLDKAPYCCNVGNCTYSSNDKSTLTRHMRIHTGEKPYECKLCNYGFTTKANCERHLKNKHGKTNREQIRENLIVHETEETIAQGEVPTMIQKLQLEAQRESGNFRCKVCKQLFLTSEKVMAHAIKDHPAYSSDVDHIFEELKGRGGGGRKSMSDTSAPSMVPRVTNYPAAATSRQLASASDQKREESKVEPENDVLENDAPLDLSRSVKPSESPPALVVGNPLQAASLAAAGTAGGSVPLVAAATQLDPAIRDELIKSNAAAAAGMGLFPPTVAASPLFLPQAAGVLPANVASLAAAGAIRPPPHNQAAAAQAAIAAAALQMSSLNPAAAAALMPAAAAALNLLPDMSNLNPEMRQRLQQQQQQQLAAALASASLLNQQNPLAATITQLQQQHQQQQSAFSSVRANAGVASASQHPTRAEEITAYINSQQEILRKQQQQQGEKSSMVAAAETLQSLSQTPVVSSLVPPPPQSNKDGSPSHAQESKGESVGGSHSSTKGNETVAPSPVPNERGNNSDSDSNYKMVIQNGVLMRKQKQRRYRTERPYGCAHCSARFTLRSNMERHIKQQHPQFWSSKPRGSRRNHAATVPVLAPQYRGDDDNGGDAPMEIDEKNDDAGDEDAANGRKGDEENSQDLVSVSKLLDSATNQTFKHLFNNDDEDVVDKEKNEREEEEEEDQEVSEEGGEECSSHSNELGTEKKKSAYSAAPHKISCPYCSRKFPWTSSLNRHILTHTGDKPYKCNFCPLFFTTKSNCDRHQVRKHGASLCGASNGSSSSVGGNEHTFASNLNFEFGDKDEDDYSEEDDAKDMSEDKATSDDLPFRCHLCQDSFRDQSDAIGHLQISHAEEYEEYVSRGAFADSKQVVSNTANGGEEEDERGEHEDEEAVETKKVSCLFCLSRFWSAEKLRRHVRKHTGERPYTCDICHKRFTQKHSMLRHRKKHDSGVSSDGGSESEAELQISCNTDEEKEQPVQEMNGNSQSCYAGTKLKIIVDGSEAAIANSVSTSTTPSPCKVGGGRKRASLMDTIAKLSSAKKKKVEVIS